MTDAYRIATYQSSCKVFDKLSIIGFADRLTWDLIYNNDPKDRSGEFIPPTYIQPSENGVEVSCIELSTPTSSLSSVSELTSLGISELMKH